MNLRRRSGQGTLFIVAILLAASGALRLGSDLGVALARTDEGIAETTPEPQECAAPPLAVAEALGLREDRLAAREAALQDRLAALDLAEQAITGRIAEMQALEEKLRATVALADGAAEADVERLTVVYQAMKPKDAAALFEAMAPEFAAGFLGRMQPDAAAAILSGMSSEAAYGISVIIAGRNANAPKD
jgi:flagellar motility protein MotE (MotC chaperone)